MRRKLNKDDVDRRISFLLSEASRPNPIRDQSVTFTLRAVGNYFAVGQDCGSAYLTLKCQYRSHKAHELYQSIVGDRVGSGAELLRREVRWRKLMTNEHQEPLKQVWAWMCRNHSSLDVGQVAKRIMDWPIVVVTRDPEDIELRKLAIHELGPLERYEQAKIEVWKVSDGCWQPRIL